MIINNNQTNINDFAIKIIDGLKVGLKKMAEKAAANNENLIIGTKDGLSKSVPAKELLKSLEK